MMTIDIGKNTTLEEFLKIIPEQVNPEKVKCFIRLYYENFDGIPVHYDEFNGCYNIPIDRISEITDFDNLITKKVLSVNKYTNQPTFNTVIYDIQIEHITTLIEFIKTIPDPNAYVQLFKLNHDHPYHDGLDSLGHDQIQKIIDGHALNRFTNYNVCHVKRSVRYDDIYYVTINEPAIIKKPAKLPTTLSDYLNNNFNIFDENLKPRIRLYNTDNSLLLEVPVKYLYGIYTFMEWTVEKAVQSTYTSELYNVTIKKPITEQVENKEKPLIFNKDLTLIEYLKNKKFNPSDTVILYSKDRKMTYITEYREMNFITIYDDLDIKNHYYNTEYTSIINPIDIINGKCMNRFVNRQVLSVLCSGKPTKVVPGPINMKSSYQTMIL